MNANSSKTTHVKISQLVAGLQTSRQQVVFARLVPSCLQVWNKLLTTWNNLVEIIKLVMMLFLQACYNHNITILLQCGVVNLVTFLLHHNFIRLVKTPCIKSDNAIKLVGQAVRTQPVDNLSTDLLRLVCRHLAICAFLRV